MTKKYVTAAPVVKVLNETEQSFRHARNVLNADAELPRIRKCINGSKGAALFFELIPLVDWLNTHRSGGITLAQAMEIAAAARTIEEIEEGAI